jgi:hypothetical protein
VALEAELTVKDLVPAAALADGDSSGLGRQHLSVGVRRIC